MLLINLTKKPEMTAGNELHVVGNFPTQPLQIQYDLLFLQIDGVWRIQGMGVDAVPVQAMASAAPQPGPAPAAAPPSPQSGKPTATAAKSDKSKSAN